ncbi:MAG: SPOR domain-containing protein [Candidatus Rokubacteria bacterium]|nr:SPOR domain-containing protein [Candidatus Rokubacteria bacterium]
MSPERDDYEDEEEYEEEEEPQSIFAATWFRALLIVIILAVVGVLALPYALDWFKAAPKPAVSIVKPVPAPVQPARPAPPAAPAPAPKIAEPPPKPTPPPAAPSTPAPAPKVAEKPAEPAPKPAVSAPATAPAKGDYWVQVGAFSHAKNAAGLAAKLTAEKYSVQRATVKRGGGGEGGNEIFAAGVRQQDLYDKVKSKGLRADAVKGGSVVRPLLPLRDAVALSKELADAGMDVKIRRVGPEKGTFYLVRIGGFADRKEADAAKAELEGKGIPGFIVKGPPR